MGNTCPKPPTEAGHAQAEKEAADLKQRKETHLKRLIEFESKDRKDIQIFNEKENKKNMAKALLIGHIISIK